MAITNFQQTIWSKKIKEALETITSLRNHCDFQYEADSKNAKEVKILNVVRPTIRTYVPGTPITREGGTDGSITLQINQFKYFNFEVDDVDKAQSVPGLKESLSKEAARGLAEEGDKYVASLIKAGTEAGSDPLAQSTSTISLSKSNVVRSIEDGFATLYGNNCKVSDTFYLEVGAKESTVVREALTELATENADILKKGAIGKYANAYVTIENLLPVSTDGSARYNVLRTNKAIAFAEQINKVEAYRPQDAFSDAIKGLYTYGALITRPEEIYVIKTAV